MVRNVVGPATALGFALQLLLIRFLNYVLAQLHLVPPLVVRFVGQQLEVDPSLLEEYSQRPQTQDDHWPRFGPTWGCGRSLSPVRSMLIRLLSKLPGGVGLSTASHRASPSLSTFV